MDHRNAKRAAAELNLSPAAISHGLARMRELLGDPLFVRRPHGLDPTLRALQLAPQVDAIVELASEILGGDTAFDPANSARRFNLSCPEFVSFSMVAPLLQQVRHIAPRISVRVTHLSQSSAFDGLKRGELDLALGRFEAPNSDASNPVREVLYEDHYCVAVRSRHPSVGKSLSKRQYAECRHVFATAESEIPLAETKADYGHLDVAAFVPQWLTALNVVSKSDAIATCPRRLADTASNSLRIRVLDCPYSFSPIPVEVARRSAGSDLGVEWLLDQIRQLIR